MTGRDGGVTIRFEQAVYGSFPFWDRGYDLLAASPGCRREWVDAFRLACARFGEPTAGAEPDGAIFSIRLGDGTRLVAGVATLGVDDRGRPGALAFHGLFAADRAMAKVGHDPFALAAALRSGWSRGATLDAGSIVVGPAVDAPPGGPPNRAARAILAGRRVVVESPTPIGDLARSTWAALPGSARRRASLATLAFGDASRFDLLATPRRLAVALDESSATFPGPEEAGAVDPDPPRPAGRWRWRWRPRLAPTAAVAAAIIAGLVAIRRPARPPSPIEAARPEAAPPSPIAPGAPAADPGERARVAEGLVDLAERFGVREEGAAGEVDPAALMARIADRLRYRGPRLSEAERAEARASADAESARALALDAHIGHFAADRPLPAGFDRGPLAWQLACFAWSFRVEVPPGSAPSDLPFLVGDALAVPAPTRPGPTPGRYPALAAYDRFLGRLPRRPGPG